MGISESFSEVLSYGRVEYEKGEMPWVESTLLPFSHMVLVIWSHGLEHSFSHSVLKFELEL